MFAAAMLYAAPNVECSIYSTCKRISQKLLRNVAMFLETIYEALNVPKYRVIRANMEELVVQGPETSQDRRTVNSYPSKVSVIFYLVAQSARKRSLQSVEIVGPETEFREHSVKSDVSRAKSNLIVLFVPIGQIPVDSLLQLQTLCRVSH